MLAAVLSGCLSGQGDDAAGTPGQGDGAVPDFAFSPPAVVAGLGYEPGLKVARDGTLVLHAHRSGIAGDGTQMASYLWWSRDDGATWTELQDPGGVRKSLFAFEGDVAFDEAGHLFFLDNYLADHVVSRWRLEDEGPMWESTVPVAGTDGADDRPWLEAWGDGQLALVSKNPILPGPHDLAQGRTDLGSYRLYRSSDAGATWTLGALFAGSNWCDIAVSPTDPALQWVFCVDEIPIESTGPRITLHASTDLGASWQATDLGLLATGFADRFPSIQATAAGLALAAWADDDPEDDAPAVLQVLRQGQGQEPEVLDVTPFNGTVQRPWVCADDRVAAVAFYATEDVIPGTSSEWHAYALMTGELAAVEPAWTLVQLDPTPVAVRGGSPADFFQCSVALDGAVHVTYLRESGPPPLPVSVVYGGEILHVRQTAGPNLRA